MAEVLPRFLPVLLAGLAVAVEVALGAFALALVAGLAPGATHPFPDTRCCARQPGPTSSSCAARRR